MKKTQTKRKIQEFHPRGSAGHREIHSAKAAHKGILPYAGKGVKHPKEVILVLPETKPGGSAGRREIFVPKNHHKAAPSAQVKGVKRVR